MNESTRLFTLRMWQMTENEDPAAPEWRGKVQSLPDGEAYYFGDWLDLVRSLERMLSAGGGEREEP